MAAAAQSSSATRVKLSEGSDVFKRLEENKTVLHLLCSLNRAEELAGLLQQLSKEDAALALAQVWCFCLHITTVSKLDCAASCQCAAPICKLTQPSPPSTRWTTVGARRCSTRHALRLQLKSSRRGAARAAQTHRTPPSSQACAKHALIPRFVATSTPPSPSPTVHSPPLANWHTSQSLTLPPRRQTSAGHRPPTPGTQPPSSKPISSSEF
jgi:hypothetical protein